MVAHCDRHKLAHLVAILELDLRTGIVAAVGGSAG